VCWYRFGRRLEKTAGGCTPERLGIRTALIEDWRTGDARTKHGSSNAFHAALSRPKMPLRARKNGLFQGAKPPQLSGRPLHTLRCRLTLRSLCEATPRVRQVKKPHLVARICDQPRQLEAIGAVASTLFGTHTRFQNLKTRTPTDGPNALPPERFRQRHLPHHNLVTCARSQERGTPGSRWTSNSDGRKFTCKMVQRSSGDTPTSAFAWRSGSNRLMTRRRCSPWRRHGFGSRTKVTK
jgi:hypothetical protein